MLTFNYYTSHSEQIQLKIATIFLTCSAFPSQWLCNGRTTGILLCFCQMPCSYVQNRRLPVIPSGLLNVAIHGSLGLSSGSHSRDQNINQMTHTHWPEINVYTTPPYEGIISWWKLRAPFFDIVKHCLLNMLDKIWWNFLVVLETIWLIQSHRS